MSQSLAQIYVHIVFSTKYRIPFLKEKSIQNELYSYMASVLNEYNSMPHIIGGTENHVHILSNLARTESLAKIIKEVKRSSSKWIKNKPGPFPLFQWQNGYGAFSVSHSKINFIKKYILNQEEHHKTMTFEEEIRQLYSKHNVEYDEKYLWN